MSVSVGGKVYDVDVKITERTPIVPSPPPPPSIPPPHHFLIKQHYVVPVRS